MIRAVLFDLYGVLGLNGWQEFKHKHFSEDPVQWELLRSLGQAVDAREASYEDLVNEIARASGVAHAEVRQSLEGTKPNYKLLEFIRHELSGYKVGVLSNANSHVMEKIFSPEDLALFDDVVLSVDTGLTKPDEAMFALACERLDVMPDECLFVDDKTSNLEAAQKVGMHPVHFQNVEQATRAIKRELAI